MTITQMNHGLLNPLAPKYEHPMQQDVAIFHRSFGLPDLIGTPQALPQDRVDLRTSLIREEGVVELLSAASANGGAGDLIEIIDALIDTIYVSLGGLVEMGHPVRRLSLTPLPLSKKLGVVDIAVRMQTAISRSLDSLEIALRAEDEDRSVELFSTIAVDSSIALRVMGVPPQPFFDEVQRANMSKLGADGKPVHSRGLEIDGFPEGKVLKGPNYSPPNLARVYDELIDADALRR